MTIYRAYHIDARGQIAGLSNFSATSDANALDRSNAMQAEGKWPDVEVWDCGRRVRRVTPMRNVTQSHDAANTFASCG
jgi:hypothetical protein